MTTRLVALVVLLLVSSVSQGAWRPAIQNTIAIDDALVDEVVDWSDFLAASADHAPTEGEDRADYCAGGLWNNGSYDGANALANVRSPNRNRRAADDFTFATRFAIESAAWYTVDDDSFTFGGEADTQILANDGTGGAPGSVLFNRAGGSGATREAVSGVVLFDRQAYLYRYTIGTLELDAGTYFFHIRPVTSTRSSQSYWLTATKQQSEAYVQQNDGDWQRVSDVFGENWGIAYCLFGKLLAPDLRVDGIQVPAEGVEREQVEVSWTVKNFGTEPALPNWFDRVYFSKDNRFDNGDSLAYAYERNVQLDPNASYTASALVRLPQNPGDYYVIVRTDADGEVNEGEFENNNVGVSAKPIKVKQGARADLVARKLDPSTQDGVAGEMISANWQVANEGGKDTSGGWVDRLYASTTDRFDDAFAIAVASSPTGLDIGESYDSEVAFKLPSEPGKYWLFIKADANNNVDEGSAEGNNIARSAVQIDVRPAPRANLRASKIVGPTDVVAGKVALVEWTVENTGESDAAAPWTDRIGISRTGDPDDAIELADFKHDELLAVGASYLGRQAVEVPINIEGEYVFVVWTDILQQVDERGREDDNALLAEIKTIVTQPPLPDLAPVAFDVPAKGVTRGEIEIRWITDNIGDLPAEKSWTDLIFVSKSDTLDGSAIQIGSRVQTGPIDAGASYDGVAKVRMLGELGDYWIFILSNADRVVEEGAGRQNNSVRSRSTIKVDYPPRPDLQVARIDAPPTGAIGQAIDVTWAITNSGEATATGTWSERVLASSDNQVGGDVLLGNFVFSDNDLGVEENIERKRTIYVPNMPEGYYLVVIVDANGSVDETNEQNNASVCADKSDISLPNLVVAELNSPVTGVADDEVEVSFVIENLGGVKAYPVWLDAVYLSTDRVLSADDLFVTSLARLSELPASSSYDVVASVTIPGRIRGSYYFIVAADAADGVEEGPREGDNALAATSTIEISQPSRPNLVVTDIVAPTSGLVSTSTKVAWTVKNTSSDTNAQGVWTDRVIARAVNKSLPDVVLADEFFVLNLKPGESYSHTEDILYPADPAEYRIIIVTDRTDAINEGLDGGEGDNSTSDNATFFAESYAVTAETDTQDAVSGTTVVIHGTTTSRATGERIPNLPVDVFVELRGTRRVLNRVFVNEEWQQLTSDENGEYSIEFKPIGTEGGLYRLFAGPPGQPDPNEQDRFRLWGIQANPRDVRVEVAPGGEQFGRITISNAGELPLTGLAVQIEGGASGLEIETLLSSSTIAPLSSVTLDVTIRAAPDYFGKANATIRFSSDSGATDRTTIEIVAIAASPTLVATPTSLKSKMLRDEQTLVEVVVKNIGAGTARDLRFFPPSETAWLTSPSRRIPDLATGESTTVLVQLLPSSDRRDDNPNYVDLGIHRGRFLIGDVNRKYGANVDYEFTAASNRTSSVLVRVENEGTFWTKEGIYDPNGPLVDNARVQLLDPATGGLIAERQTGKGPQPAEFPNIPEGIYMLAVSAPNHAPYRSNIRVLSNEDNTFRAFTPYEGLRYQWTVRETEIEDVTIITLEAVFQTVVPAPVLTIDPPLLDLDTIEGDSMDIDFTITNQGLIRAEAANFTFGSHPCWKITPMIENLGDLEAKQSIVVPVHVERTSGGGCEAPGPIPCTIDAKVVWSLVCINRQYYSVPVIVVNVHGDCGGGPGGGGGGDGCWCGGGGQGGPSEPYAVQPSYVPPYECSKCDPDNYKPRKVKWDFGGLGFIADAIEEFVTYITATIIEPDVEIETSGTIETCCTPDGGVGLKLSVDVESSVSVSAGPGVRREVDLSYQLPVEVGAEGCDVEETVPIGIGLSGEIGAAAEITGTGELNINVTTGCNFGDPKVTASGCIKASGYIGGEAQASIDLGALPDCAGVYSCEPFNVKLNAQTGAGLCFTYVDGKFDWDGCFDGVYLEAGIKIGEGCNLPAWLTGGIGDPDKPIYLVCPASASGRKGEKDPCGELECGDGLRDEDDWRNILDIDKLEADLRRLIDEEIKKAIPKQIYVASVRRNERNDGLRDGDGVCAEVRLQLEQRVAITRTAFTAALDIDNTGKGATIAESIFVDFDIYDADGNIATDLFVIGEPRLSNLSAVDGTGVVDPDTSARASWLIVPLPEAAPFEPAEYFVSGVFQFTQDGKAITAELQPASITVRPDPSLFLKYFWQRDVFSDDPDTKEIIEPAEPFSLGLLLTNRGYGEARNVRITTSEPKIIENARGLLIDFDLIGAYIGNQEITPSLSLTLGDIAPGATAVVRWLLTSSLQGQFVSYEAKFENTNELGDSRLSLIDSVEIFELIHVVRADDRSDDGLIDFLVNEVEFPDDPAEDPEDADKVDLPDHVHLSDGSVLPAKSVVDDVVVTADEAHLVATVSVPMPDEWSYVKFADPFDGYYPLDSISREDGKSLIATFNFWQTDRSFRKGNDYPFRLNRIHLFDRGGSGQYTLRFLRAARIPEEPELGRATSTTVQIISLGSLNRSDTEHAVYEEVNQLWVGADGRLATEPFWQARDAWIDTIVTRLYPNSQYRFMSKARFEGVESALGPAAAIKTRGAGDTDCNGRVEFDDIDSFVDALIGRNHYEALYPDCDWLNGDADQDGVITFNDIDAFIQCVIDNGCK